MRPTDPLSFPSAAPCAPPAVEVEHGGYVGVAPRAAGLVYAHAPGARVVGRPPGLRDGAPEHVPGPAVAPDGRLGHRLDGRAPHAGREHLGLEEGREVRVRPHLPGHEHGPRAVPGAVRPRHGAVHVGPGLPDAGVAPGALAGVARAAGDAAHRAGDRVAAPPGHPGAGLVGTPLDLLEPGPRDLPGLAQPHRAPEERRQHPRVPAHRQPPWSVTA